MEKLLSWQHFLSFIKLVFKHGQIFRLKYTSQFSGTWFEIRHREFNFSLTSHLAESRIVSCPVSTMFKYCLALIYFEYRFVLLRKYLFTLQSTFSLFLQRKWQYLQVLLPLRNCSLLARSFQCPTSGSNWDGFFTKDHQEHFMKMNPSIFKI